MDPTRTNLFDSIHPWTHSVHVLPNPLMGNVVLDSPDVRITVVDSGSAGSEPVVVGIFIPNGRENDWLFTTVTGYKQLSEKYWKVSRFILIGNSTTTSCKDRYDRIVHTASAIEAAEEGVMAILRNFIPLRFRGPCYRLPFIHFNDGLTHRRYVAGARDPNLLFGDFAIMEEVVRHDGKNELMKRLRFEKTAGWIHAEVVVVAVDPVTLIPKAVEVSKDNWESDFFKVETNKLVDARSSRAMIYGLKPVFKSLREKS